LITAGAKPPVDRPVWAILHRSCSKDLRNVVNKRSKGFDVMRLFGAAMKEMQQAGDGKLTVF
jgi:hypothetical protein